MVMLDFFETVVRYDKFFACEPQHIPDVLVSYIQTFQNTVVRVFVK